MKQYIFTLIFSLMLVCLGFITSPVAARDLTRSNIPLQRQYTLTPIPGTNKSVLNYTTTECAPPQGLIGRHMDTLQDLSFQNPIRVLKPGDMKTMDFNPKRINFGVDHRGYIRAISCG